MGAPDPRSVIKNRAKKSAPKSLWTPRGRTGVLYATSCLPQQRIITSKASKVTLYDYILNINNSV